jgi:hypothetical protein
VRRGAQLVSIGGLCHRTILTWHHMAKYLQLFFPETTEPFENNFISWNAPWMILYKLLFFCVIARWLPPQDIDKHIDPSRI